MLVDGLVDEACQAPARLKFSVATLQIGIAVAVICITYFKLAHINSFRVDDWKHIGHAADAYYNGTQPYTFDGRCWLDSNTASGTACVYAYALAGVSILATIIVSTFLVRRPITPCLARVSSRFKGLKMLQSIGT